MIIEKIIEDITKMLYLFNANKDDNFCSIILDSLTGDTVKILELIEQDNPSLWCDTVRKLHKNYNIMHYYYLGSDEYYNVLKLIFSGKNKLLYRKEWEDLSIDKLIRKLTNNLIELPLDWEHLKQCIFDNDIKIDSLKLIASINYFWVDETPEDNGIFSYYERKKEERIKHWTPFGDISLEQVLRYFD